LIVFGTTSDAFFSLHRLADFLGQSSLGLTMALNLDGGPLACQAVRVNGFNRDFCGERELQADGQALKLLQPLVAQRRWALPIVISVSRNDS
jgi:hypothetical protein